MPDRFSVPYSNPRWWWEGSYIPTCFECAHFRGAYKGLPRCEAFPDGIPRDLMKRDARHDEPYSGDNGILFEKAED